MVTYATHWNILDKDKKVLSSVRAAPCWGAVTGKPFLGNAHYFEYDFSNYDKSLSVKKMHQYFLFLKAIPEFAPMMPFNVYDMAETHKVAVDLTKHNGLRIFSFLTAVRAVREDPYIVHEVLNFDPEKEYEWTKLGILKAAGSVHHHNTGHWLTGKVSIKNINKSPENKVAWKKETIAKETGFIRGINTAFESAGDGFGCMTPVTMKDIKAMYNPVPVEEEQQPKKKTTKLILDF